MNLLKKFGYVKINELTEIEKLDLIIYAFGNPSNCEVSEQLDKEFFTDLSKIDTAAEYLKNTAGKDISRYFAAKDESERMVVRGGFLRTAYLLKKIKQIRQNNLQQE